MSFIGKFLFDIHKFFCPQHICTHFSGTRKMITYKNFTRQEFVAHKHMKTSVKTNFYYITISCPQHINTQCKKKQKSHMSQIFCPVQKSSMFTILTFISTFFTHLFLKKSRVCKLICGLSKDSILFRQCKLNQLSSDLLPTHCNLSNLFLCSGIRSARIF
jgi:hypothetical protein